MEGNIFSGTETDLHENNGGNVNNASMMGITADSRKL